MWLRRSKRMVAGVACAAVLAGLAMPAAAQVTQVPDQRPITPPADVTTPEVAAPRPPSPVPLATPTDIVPPTAAAPQRDVVVPQNVPPENGLPQREAPVRRASPTPDVNNPVKQAGQVLKDLATGDVKALRRGPLLIHGNYCGIGNRPGSVPTDALDAACMRHDACTRTGKMPSCPCDNRLRIEATAIANDPATPPKLQALATAMAASMVVLVCK